MTTAADVPRITELARRVRLTALGLTEPGDVFYLVSDPATVWMRADYEDYPFSTVGRELYFRLFDVGSGDSKQTVVVVHNTRIPPQARNGC